MTESQTLSELIQKEKELRKKITSFDGYLDIVEEIEEIDIRKLEKQAELDLQLFDVNEMQKSIQAMKSLMIKNNDFDSDIFTPKYKITKTVNINKLYSTLDSPDQFMLMVSVTQKALKDYAKEEENKDKLLSCIEESGKKVVDLKLNIE